jgi:hypothetical protein
LGLGFIGQLVCCGDGLLVCDEALKEGLHRAEQQVEMALETETVLLDNDFDELA